MMEMRAMTEIMTTFEAGRLFSAGGIIFLTVALVCAFLRWKHSCRHFAGDMDSRHVRNVVTAFFAGTILTLPYVLFPASPSVWIYTTSVELLYYPTFITIMMRAYFRFDAGMNRHSWSTLAFVPVICIVSLVVLLAGYRKWIMWHGKEILMVSGAISACLTAMMIKVLRSLKKKADKFNTENYSSDEDFPYRFLMRILYYPIFWMACVWVCSITGSRWVRLVADLLTSVWMVSFLSILLEPAPEPEEDLTDSAQEDDVVNEIQDEVLSLILKHFREPHLLKSEILMEIGSGKVNSASKFISSIGYYRLVNMFRLEYARQYKEAHPHAKQEEIAAESGFVSRTAYYKAKRSIGTIDRILTADVHLQNCGKLDRF